MSTHLTLLQKQVLLRNKYVQAGLFLSVREIRRKCSSSTFLASRVLSKADVLMWSTGIPSGARRRRPGAVCTVTLVLFPFVRCLKQSVETRGRQFLFHFSFPFFPPKGPHLMWSTFSSVFNRLRLGCTKSSSESSVSPSSILSFVSGHSVTGVSGKLCPGNISCNFSSKYRLTALPDIAISDSTWRRRRRKRRKSRKREGVGEEEGKE